MKIQKTRFFFGGGGWGSGGGIGLGGQGGCERRIEVFVKIQKKNWGGVGWEGVGLEGGQGGCDRRIEVFGKIHTKKSGGRGVGSGGGGASGWEGVRVDVNEELKFS